MEASQLHFQFCTNLLHLRIVISRQHALRRPVLHLQTLGTGFCLLPYTFLTLMLNKYWFHCGVSGPNLKLICFDSGHCPNMMINYTLSDSFRVWLMNFIPIWFLQSWIPPIPLKIRTTQHTPHLSGTSPPLIHLIKESLKPSNALLPHNLPHFCWEAVSAHCPLGVHCFDGLANLYLTSLFPSSPASGPERNFPQSLLTCWEDLIFYWNYLGYLCSAIPSRLIAYVSLSPPPLYSP